MKTRIIQNEPGAARERARQTVETTVGSVPTLQESGGPDGSLEREP